MAIVASYFPTTSQIWDAFLDGNVEINNEKLNNTKINNLKIVKKLSVIIEEEFK
jgi:hypothetical protein